jgi:hypothetical protein
MIHNTGNGHHGRGRIASAAGRATKRSKNSSARRARIVSTSMREQKRRAKNRSDFAFRLPVQCGSDLGHLAFKEKDFKLLYGALLIIEERE